MIWPVFDFDNDGVNDLPVLITFFLSALLSSFAGLAALLRNPTKPSNFKNIVTYILNGGLIGLAICLLWYIKFKDNVFFLIGLCIVGGLGGLQTIEYAIEWGKNRFFPSNNNGGK